MSSRSIEVEGALADAAIFAEIVTQWMATCIGFEEKEPPKLTEDDCTRIYWAMNKIATMTREADALYQDKKILRPVFASA